MLFEIISGHILWVYIAKIQQLQFSKKNLKTFGGYFSQYYAETKQQ